MKLQLLFALLLMAVSAQAQSGIRWSDPTRIAASSFGNLHPRIVLNRSNSPLVIWGRASDESVFISRWDGQRFTSPTKLNGTLKIATASWMGPQIAAHGDTVYVIMKQTPENSTSSHIYIVRSEDGGVTFSSPLRVDNIADSISRFPTVTCDTKGNPIVGFMKFDAKFRDSRWVVTTSSDLGRTFSADVKASGWAGATGVCDCCPGAVVQDNDMVAMLYRNNASDIRDIWMGVSNDNGSSFISGCNVDNNNWELPSCPATGPDGVVVGDTLYSVFCSAPEGYYRTFLSRSSIRGIEHYRTQRLPEGPNGVSQQNYPRIASFGKAVGVVWKQNVMGVAQLPIMFTSDVSIGFPETIDTVDVGDVTNGDIAIGNGTVAVCWEDPNAGVVGVRMGTFSSTSTGITHETDNQVVSVFPNPATDYLVVDAPIEVPSTVTIYTALGQEVIPPTKANQRPMIDVAMLSTGTYRVGITVGKDTYLRTITIHR